MDEVTIYTDGACSGNPGPGGWGSVLIYKDVKRYSLSLTEQERHLMNEQIDFYRKT